MLLKGEKKGYKCDKLLFVDKKRWYSVLRYFLLDPNISIFYELWTLPPLSLTHKVLSSQTHTHCSIIRPSLLAKFDLVCHQSSAIISLLFFFDSLNSWYLCWWFLWAALSLRLVLLIHILSFMIRFML